MMVKPKHKRYAKKLSIAAGSLSALAFGAQEAEADVVYFGNSSFTVNFGGTGVGWDVDADSTDDFQFNINGGGSVLLANGLGRAFVRNVTSNTLLPQAINRLTSAMQIGPSLPANYAFGPVASRLILLSDIGGNAIATNSARNFQGDADNFVGFRFNQSGSTRYGWARFNINAAETAVTVVDWGYESEANTSIEVGATPEPSSFALMAAGAAGVLGWKRRRRNGAEGETETDAEIA